MHDVLQAFDLEAICNSRHTNNFEPPGPIPSNQTLAVLKRRYWHYKCVGRPYVRKALAGFLIVVALAIIWSEATIFTGVR